MPIWTVERMAEESNQQIQVSPLEEQSLNTCRTALKVFIGVYVAAFFFLISLQDARVRDLALQELDTLATLNINEIVWNAALSDAKARRFLENGGLVMLRKAMTEKGIVLNTDADKYGPANFLTIDPKMIDVQNTSIEKIYSYVSNVKRISVSVVPLTQDAVELITKNLGHGNNDVTAQVSVVMHANGYGFQLAIRDSNSMRMFGTTEINIPGKPETQSAEIQFDLLKHLGQDSKMKILVNEGEFIPNSRASSIWNKIRTEMPVEARTVVAREPPPKENSLEFLGVSIPHQFFSWVIPFVALTVNVFLLIHLQHFLPLMRRNSAIRLFPWFVVMKGVLPSIASSFAIVILPVITLAMTIVRIRSPGGSTQLAFVSGLMILNFLALFFCWHTLKRIRDVVRNADWDPPSVN